MFCDLILLQLNMIIAMMSHKYDKGLNENDDFWKVKIFSRIIRFEKLFPEIWSIAHKGQQRKSGVGGREGGREGNRVHVRVVCDVPMYVRVSVNVCARAREGACSCANMYECVHELSLRACTPSCAIAGLACGLLPQKRNSSYVTTAGEVLSDDPLRIRNDSAQGCVIGAPLPYLFPRVSRPALATLRRAKCDNPQTGDVQACSPGCPDLP
jgi:hypothetical protein